MGCLGAQGNRFHRIVEGFICQAGDITRGTLDVQALQRLQPLERNCLSDGNAGGCLTWWRCWEGL